MAGPGQITTRQDFARELTLLREGAGLTVRQVASRAGDQFSHSTIGGWFAGRGLPATSSADLLARVLGVCGVDEPGLVEQWIQAWWRVRRAPGRPSGCPEPYRGLASFRPEHAEWFFGREKLTARLAALCATGGVRLVVGASGSGKSSLLGAGLIPAVRGNAVLLTPGRTPMDALAAVPDDGALVLVVDQFEEIFAADDGRQREFVAALGEIADRGAVVVLGLRADFYAHALRHPRLLAAAADGQFTVGPMTPPELREAILGPAHRANIEVEDGLVELLLREVAADPGGLPQLSHALYRMWDRGDGRRLTAAGYREVGGIGGAVAASAEGVYADLDDTGRELARRLFLSLVHVAPDAADTRRRVTAPALLTDLPGTSAADLAHVLDSFVAQRLITVDADTVQISHEALLTAWPRLRDWLTADRGRLLAGRQVAGDAEAWQRHGRDALYRGVRLAAAQEWAADRPAEATGLVREFLDASTRHAQRRVRRLGQLVAVLAALVVLAVSATVLAVTAQREATEQRNTALSEKVAGEAAGLRRVNPALAAQLSLAAYRLDPGPAARGSLLSSLAEPAASILPATDSVYAVTFSPDGRTVVTAARDRILDVWNTADPYRPAHAATFATDQDGAVVALALAPDGHTLATGSWDHTVELWDLTRHRHLTTITGHTDHVVAVAFSPDGRLLATAGSDRTVQLWDLTRHRRLTTITGHTATVNAVAFSPDGRTLATAGNDGTARLWNLTGAALATLTGHDGGVRSVAFSPDGRTLATAGDDATSRLWNLTARPPARAGHPHRAQRRRTRGGLQPRRPHAGHRQRRPDHPPVGRHRPGPPVRGAHPRRPPQQRAGGPVQRGRPDARHRQR